MAKGKNRNSKDVKIYYYLLWCRSASEPEFEHMTVRIYLQPQKEEDLDLTLKEWASVLDNQHPVPDDATCGHELLTKLPRSREDLLSKLDVCNKRRTMWSRRQKILSCLLRLTPFNGRKLLDIHGEKERQAH